MKKTFLVLICLLLSGGVALALPLGTSLQNVLNGVTILPTPGVSSVNVQTDFISEGNDAGWSITGSGGSISTIVIELSGVAGQNSFGIYDANDTSKRVELLSGGATQGDQSLVSIKANGSVVVNFVDSGKDFTSNLFGFYLDSPSGIFYSDTDMNYGDIDHMFAYQGKNLDNIQIPGWAGGLWTNNEYVLAWEDSQGGGDFYYDDFVVMVASVNPVPEPVSMLLFSTGLVGIGGYVRRKSKK